jgi:hypothetical protein
MPFGTALFIVHRSPNDFVISWGNNKLIELNCLSYFQFGQIVQLESIWSNRKHALCTLRRSKHSRCRPSRYICGHDREWTINTGVNFTKYSVFSPRNWFNQKTNGTIRKCSSRAFQLMVTSVGSADNLKFFVQFVCPTLPLSPSVSA